MSRSNFWKVYHTARKKFGLTDQEARGFSREWREKTGERPRPRDLAKHPGIARKVAELALLKGKRRKRKKEKREKPKGAIFPKEWEATIKYGKGRNKVDITVRLIGPLGADADTVRKVLYRGAKRGDLTSWDVKAVSWDKRGKQGEARDPQRELMAFFGPIRDGTIRIEPADKRGEE